MPVPMDASLLRQQPTPTAAVPWWSPTYRLLFALLGCFGFFQVYFMRVNLSVAILNMSKEFHWSHAEKVRKVSCRLSCSSVPTGVCLMLHRVVS